MQAHGVNLSHFGLEQHHNQSVNQVFWSLGTAALVENSIRRREGLLAAGGALVVHAGQYPGRSPNVTFVVREPSTQGRIWWGRVNRPFDPARFDALYGRMLAYLWGSDLCAQDGYAGADSLHRIPIRIVTQCVWHNLFARQPFVRPTGPSLKSMCLNSQSWISRNSPPTPISTVPAPKHVSSSTSPRSSSSAAARAVPMK